MNLINHADLKILPQTLNEKLTKWSPQSCRLRRLSFNSNTVIFRQTVHCISEWRKIYKTLGLNWHYNNWRIKNQLDATCYFIVLLMDRTCFGHYYAHHQELATMMLITTSVVSFLGCCMLEVRCSKVGVVQVVLQPATRTPLQPNCTSPLTYSKPRTKRPMW